tara:strand:+ start:51 stop:215 length:165 start_codon:yes stop_codon:yes gene_type:complete
MESPNIILTTGATLVIVIAFILVAYFGLGTIAKIILTILFFIGLYYLINHIQNN